MDQGMIEMGLSWAGTMFMVNVLVFVLVGFYTSVWILYEYEYLD